MTLCKGGQTPSPPQKVEGGKEAAFDGVIPGVHGASRAEVIGTSRRGETEWAAVAQSTSWVIPSWWVGRQQRVRVGAARRVRWRCSMSEGESGIH